MFRRNGYQPSEPAPETPPASMMSGIQPSTPVEYRLLRLRPTDVLVVRVPDKLTQAGAQQTKDAIRKRLDDAGLKCADVWILDGGAEVELIRGEVEEP